MWIKRDFSQFLQSKKGQVALPIKVLKGPRQVGKTSLLDHLGSHQLVLFDDLGVRNSARENPGLFLDQFSGPLILDEATLVPEIFPELKKRLDHQRREMRKGKKASLSMDLWITCSNQTLLQKNVRESLAGRASYFTLNTLSIHELHQNLGLGGDLKNLIMKGGWPELHAEPKLPSVPYLNDFVSTFIEKDIISAAGIEKRAAFLKALQLAAGRIGQLLDFSDIARNVGVDLTTVQSWFSLLEQNGILKIVPPYFSNLNQRLIKTPKLYFEDVGLAVRLQGWNEFEPLWVSPYRGSLLENLALIEISRFFTNKGEMPEILFVRSKEKVEVDFLISLPNQRYVAAEVKSLPQGLEASQNKLLESLKLNILEKWVLGPTKAPNFGDVKSVPFFDIFQSLGLLMT